MHTLFDYTSKMIFENDKSEIRMNTTDLGQKTNSKTERKEQLNHSTHICRLTQPHPQMNEKHLPVISAIRVHTTCYN